MAVGDAHGFPGLLTAVLTQLSFQGHQLFSHASEVRGKNMPERKFASTGYQTHNNQVMSQRCSPLSHPGGLRLGEVLIGRNSAYSKARISDIALDTVFL